MSRRAALGRLREIELRATFGYTCTRYRHIYGGLSYIYIYIPLPVFERELKYYRQLSPLKIESGR